ncbi:taurine transport system permease protein [Roseibium hamelinense]|uniref:Taurine transport system permease protein n=1 Tax=Roseibium hamelinense TaxID=150831 RepID=A0A562T1S5_9HYPH|nr:ABC transporter permease subunit [Roseibium hamelinense]MTI43811.1 ABC transporter permease subunit [Roseibium hamelinense]TWI87108.1 taurine transport system permease protein [Roseibium hamelinense]
MTILVFYITFFAAAFGIVHFTNRRIARRIDFTSLKTVTFGDESAVSANRIASVLSILAIFFIWAAFTGSSLTPFHVPGPFVGETRFSYTAQNAFGETDSATVVVVVHERGQDFSLPTIGVGDGFVKNDVDSVTAWRSGLVRVHRNDIGSEKPGFRVVAVDGHPISAGKSVRVRNGSVVLTPKGSLNFTPDKGFQMEPIWLPAPEAVWKRYTEIFGEGYQGITLLEHLGWSLLRVFTGFLLGSLIGIPLGYAMGLSGWFRGWFDPIVEFMRPVPPLALIPLVIIWFGIGESGKIFLLFLAALWIMTIAARAGVSGVNISKVHAAYSLGASRPQILLHVIVPNSLPELFTGARVAMGVCWGTVVAAELVAAEKGAGKMIVAASKFQLTDVVIMGIVLIGIIGFAIDVLMRKAEQKFIPWKGRG